jgi:2-methylisocitrate lyase-like PEP mutase family enzyme
MQTGTQVDKAQALRGMHDRRSILVLPNAWDAASARVFARLGFAAVATTSGGVAWSLGYADGEQAPMTQAIEAIGRMARVVDCPLTADLESGYGATPAVVGDTVRAVIAAGAVGINLEDGLPAGGLRGIDDAAGRLRAARDAAASAGVPIVINARTDAYLHAYPGSEADRFDETLRRGRAYLAAGADCIYPIGLSDATTIRNLVEALDAPVNIAARPGVPGVAELARLGVARVSTATRLAALAYSAVEDAARTLRSSGEFDCLRATLTHPDLQRLFDAPPPA